MTTTAADIDAAYATLRISTQYMTMTQLDAHVAAVLAMAAATPVTTPLNLLPVAIAVVQPLSAAQLALQAAQQAAALAAAPLTPATGSAIPVEPSLP